MNGVLNNIREPAAAGTFYHGSSAKLEDDINTLFYAARQISPLNSTAFIVPHAGYLYSGLTAAHVYANLYPGRYKSVIIISPSHYEYFEGISIYPGKAYRTPLGEVPIDSEKAVFLTEKSRYIFFGEQGHRREHGVEVHLPFLQKINSSFSFVPVVIGTRDNEMIDELAQKLSALIDEDTLLIASSDLSHFHTREIAGKLDGLLTKHVVNFDYNNLQNDILTGACEACGAGAIIALMKALDGKQISNPVILHKSDSSDVTRNTSAVVGYLSASLN